VLTCDFICALPDEITGKLDGESGLKRHFS
jgi:hypothetical protein